MKRQFLCNSVLMKCGNMKKAVIYVLNGPGLAQKIVCIAVTGGSNELEAAKRMNMLPVQALR